MCHSSVKLAFFDLISLRKYIIKHLLRMISPQERYKQYEIVDMAQDMKLFF